MTDRMTDAPADRIGVALVDGDATLRHARQIMLRSEHFGVRSYGTSAALLADRGSWDFACIILDVKTEDENGEEVLREMRAGGWRGRGILLDGHDSQGAYLLRAALHGDQVLDRHVGDGPLIAAITAQVDRALHGRIRAG